MKYEFEEGRDYEKINTVVGKTVQHDYSISVDMAKELCMIAKSPKGKIIRNYFIDAEKALRQLKPALADELFNVAKKFASKNIDINELVSALIDAEKKNKMHEDYLKLLTANPSNTVCITDVCCKMKDLYPQQANEYLLKVLSVI